MTRVPSASLLAPLLVIATLGGCARNVDNSASPNNATNAATIETVEDADSLGNLDNGATPLPTHDWVGRWTGPEGLFLDIQPSPNGKAGHYALTNKDNLDRQASYQGIAEGATIRFVRDGKDLAIRPGTGAETGFKYLADKQDCLIILPGKEGYCR